MFPRIRSFVSSSAQIAKTLLETGVTFESGRQACNTIQQLRELDASPLKDVLKDNASNLASTVSAFMLSISGAELLGQLIGTGVWSKLNRAQQVAIVTCLMVYVAGAGYSMNRFGVEKNTLLANEVAGTLAVFAANIASNIAFFASHANSQQPADMANIVIDTHTEQAEPTETTTLRT